MTTTALDTPNPSIGVHARPANNPFLDEHLVHAAVLVGLAMAGAGNTWGFGRRWSETDLVRRHPWLA